MKFLTSNKLTDVGILSSTSLVILGLSTTNIASAVTFKTDKGNPIESLSYFPNGIGTYPSGFFWEDGTGPPPKVTRYINRSELTPAQKQQIVNDDKASHPSIVAVDTGTWSYDCHGLTFKNKTLWINNDQVDKILNDQEWKIAAAGTHKVGDIVIYRDSSGNVTHSGIVEEVVGGNVTRVRSKWGARGEYIHDPNDVPASYGTLEVRTGGKPLTDPPLEEEDIDVFGGRIPPPLKPELSDPFVSPDAPTNFNDFPVPQLVSTVDIPFHWEFGLTIPQLGLQISQGDTLQVFANGLIDANVNGNAVLPEFGGWQVKELFSDSVIWEATSVTFVLGTFEGLIEGFSIDSTFEKLTDTVYIETVAGSIGLVKTTTPETSSNLGLFSLTILGLNSILKDQLKRKSKKGK